VPVPFPADEVADRSRPGKDQAWLSARAYATAAAPEGGLTELQEFVVRGLTQALTADLVELGDLSLLEPITAEEYALANADRGVLYRTRRVQTMVLLELLLRPLPEDVTHRVEAFAEALGLGEECRDMMAATRHLAAGATELALADFMRNGYETLHYERSGVDMPDDPDQYWRSVEDDPELAARWASLEQCPATSLGRQTWEFYKSRGFNFPGTPISVSPRLAQHDFVHVLSDYGTTVESEIEVFALIARADEDPRSFSLLIAVLALFESGYLDKGLGAFRADPDHLSAKPSDMGVRLGNAIARGGEVAWKFNATNGIDLLGVDWFELADQELTELRDRFGFSGPGARSLEAKVAGSVGPFEPGGITPAQVGWGTDMAAAEGRSYEAFGTSLSPDQV
jgi:hypothetical protein